MLRSLPILWVGPPGSGKLTAARSALGASAADASLRHLEIGEYSARYWEFPTHMEIDCTDLSMMDKQILPELLSQLLSTRDVLCSGRKLMILRHIHGLSPPAAVRLRSCLEELVWADGAPAMIWCTTRVVNGVVASLLDGFVYKRVPGEGWREKEQVAAQLDLTVDSVRGISSYSAELLRQMSVALEEGPPTLAAASWIRGRVYDLLGLMTTGAELVSALTWATVRMAAAGGMESATASAVLEVLARARWFPSYRTPLMLELILVSVYNAIAKNS